MENDEDRQREQLSAKKGRYGSTVDSLIIGPQAILLPVMTRQDHKDLDPHPTGPYPVWAFLKRDPYRIGYQATSRFIMKATTEKVRDNRQLENIALSFEDFCEYNKNLKLPRQKTYLDIIEGLKRTLKWFVPREDLHAWYFNEDDMKLTADRISKAQLPKGSIFIFVVEVILESSKVSTTEKESLQDELFVGKLFIDRVESEIATIAKSAKEACGK